MNINEILSKFNSNQIKQINDFLNSQQGKNISRQLTQNEKSELLKQFERLDDNLVKSKLNGLTKADILRMLK